MASVLPLNDGDEKPPRRPSLEAAPHASTPTGHRSPPPPSRIDTALTVLTAATELPDPVPVGEHPDGPDHHRASLAVGKPSLASGTWERLLSIRKSRTTQPSGGSTKDGTENGEKELERNDSNEAAGEQDTAGNKDGLPPEHFELITLSTVVPPFLPAMDIIAIHDIDQSSETAWAYTPHRLFQRGATMAPHMHPVNEEEEQADNVPGATSNRHKNSLKPGLLKALAEEDGHRDAHGPRSIKAWVSKIDPHHDELDVSQDGVENLEGKGKEKATTSFTKIVIEGVAQPPLGEQYLDPNISATNSRPPTPSERDKKTSSWLTDLSMLAWDLNRSRIMTFSYTAPEIPTQIRSSAIPDYDSYLKEAAESLLYKLTREKEAENQARVPVVFIGTGFGCLLIQKLLTLAAASDILDTVAGIFFFDVPVPVIEDAKKQSTTANSVFPPSPNASSRWVKAMMGAVPRLIDSGALWESFQSVTVQKDLFVCWFYRVSTSKPTKPIADAVSFVALEGVPAKVARIHGRFLGPQDPNYIRVVDRIQASILFKVSTDRELEHLLVESINHSVGGRYSALMQDHKGRCPLHLAASCGNDLAVTLLVSAFPPLSIAKDHDGLTPLHAIVLHAIEANPDEDNREPIKTIIEKLLGAIAELREIDDPKDNDGKTPWDYVQDDAHLWITWLREPSNLLTGARAEQTEKLGTLVPPVDKELTACRKSEALLVQFYIAKNGSTDYLDRQRSTIYRLIYDSRYGVENLFRRNKRTDAETRETCRWIHLPANNVSSTATEIDSVIFISTR